MFWLRYGMLKPDSTIMTVNGTGLALEAVYLVYYYAYARPKVGTVTCFVRYITF